MSNQTKRDSLPTLKGRVSLSPELMKKQEVKTDNAICQVCKWQNHENTKVKPSVSFGGRYSDGKEYTSNILFNYWSCPKHGSVGALINGKMVDNPLDLFKGEIAVYEAIQTSPAYPTTAEEFSHSLFTNKYKTKIDTYGNNLRDGQAHSDDLDSDLETDDKSICNATPSHKSRSRPQGLVIN